MKLRKLICGLMAALMLATAGGSVLAADAYQETTLPLANNASSESPFLNLFTYGNGNVDYFYATKGKYDIGALSWYHSSDGGKTWQEKDMGWNAAIREQAKQNIIEENLRWAQTDIPFDVPFEKAGKIESIYMTNEGVAYFLIRTAARLQKFESTRTETPGKTYTTYGEYELYKVKEGKAQKIPNIKLGEPITEATPFHSYQIVRAEENGKVLIAYKVVGSGSFIKKVRFLEYDEQTGKALSQSPEIAARDDKYVVSGNLAYVLDYNENSNLTLMAYDMASGKETLSLPLQTKKNCKQAGLNISPAGGIHVLTANGLYRLDPSTKALTKIMESAGTRLENAGAIGEFSMMEDGRVYNLVCENSRSVKLYCYSPK